MINGNTVLAHHLLEITVADAVAAVPAHCPKDDLALKMAPLEVTAHASPPICFTNISPANGIFLQQSHFDYMRRNVVDTDGTGEQLLTDASLALVIIGKEKTRRRRARQSYGTTLGMRAVVYTVDQIKTPH
jgi:hypothetical protein